MRQSVRRLLRSPAGEETVLVALSDCVHYYGFRNGASRFHPYETYLQERVRGCSIAEASQVFVDFLRHFRPNDIGDALGLHGLARPYPLGVFPWDSAERCRTAPSGWFTDPDDVPDIMTYCWADGISAARIEEEIEWLEGALESLRARGYQPSAMSYIETRTLVRRDGKQRHLLIDGNHRASALSALGHINVMVKRRRSESVLEAHAPCWEGVTSGCYTVEDAIAIFRAVCDRAEFVEDSRDPASVIQAGRRLTTIMEQRGTER